jgi:hypothetical protein
MIQPFSIHALINEAPMIVMALSIASFVHGWGRDVRIARTSAYVGFAIVGAFYAILLAASGEQALASLPADSAVLFAAHRYAGTTALVLAELCLTLAILLGILERNERFYRYAAPALIAVSLATFAAMLIAFGFGKAATGQ